VLLTVLSLSALSLRALAQEPPAESGEAPAPESGEAPASEPGEEEVVYPPLLVPPAVVEAAPLSWPPGEPPARHEVKLGLLLDQEGRVVDAIALSGEPAFAEAALEAVRQYRFSPATLDGEPLMVQLPYEVVFDPPPVNVTGVVRMGGSREPLEGVGVQVGPFQAETGADGTFTIRGLAPGSHPVRVASPVWIAKDATLTLYEGERAELEIWVKPRGSVQEAMGVYQRSQGQIVIHTLTAEEVRTTPGTMGDPVRAVQNLPGVVHTPLDSGWLLVRGGDPEDTGLYIDGIRVPLIYHLGGFSSVLHPAFVDRVSYMPGGYSARYGRSTAGVVDLTTQDLSEPEGRLEIGVDLLHASAYAEVPLENAGAAFAIRRSYLDRVVAWAVDDETAQIIPRFWDWQARIDGEQGGLFTMGFTDQIDAPTGEDDETVTITIGTQRFHGRYEVDISEELTLAIQPMVALEWSELELEDAQKRESTIGGGRAELRYDGGRLGGQAGVDVELVDYDLELGFSSDDEDEGSSQQVADTRYASLDPYVHARWGWEDEARIEAGLRLENIKLEEQYWRAAPSPRARGLLPVGDSLTLVADVGVYHQPPPIDVTITLPAGPALELERSWGPGGGFRLARDNFSLQSDAYWRRLEDVTLFEEDGSLVQGDGVAYGLENMFRWRWRSFSGWTAYTWSRSWRREDDDADWLPHRFDQPHYLVQVLSVALPRDWSVAGRWRAGSGYPWDPDQLEVYDLLNQETTPLRPDIFLRLEPYHSLDLKIARRAVYRSWRLDFYLDGQNLYNRRIPEPVITGVEDDETWYSFGLPTLLIFGVKGVFWP
jgi:hypothetical protein